MSGTAEVEFVTMPVNIEPLYLRTKAILLDSAVPTLNESGDEAESKKEFRGKKHVIVDCMMFQSFDSVRLLFRHVQRAFLLENKPSHKTKGNKHGYQNAKNSTPSGSGSSRQPDPGPEWPINPPRPSSPPNSGSGWPSFKVKPSPSAQFTPGIHEAKIATMQMQQKIVKCCNEFFGKKADLDSEEDNKFEEEDEGDDSFGDDNDVEETDEYKFFFGLFVEHRELRDFYEKNQETGDFYCLVV
ncbi:hypothetical protein GH714_039604 [Hevea brasiliensis]|uniref:Uncharacterized protein n=1 Tax=Hevea brasiliensis TaxID=3981 RepID=A0A6A6KEL2_HEVBR|nr:hypothetical protein GH714_039604 [Hevea brasiliensis]